VLVSNDSVMVISHFYYLVTPRWEYQLPVTPKSSMTSKKGLT